MTITGKIESTIAVPDGVSITYNDSIMKVSGSRGELSRNFAYPGINITVQKNNIGVTCEYPRIEDKAMVGTYVAHIKNMIRGVTVGFTYHLKVVFSHFPMKVATKGSSVEINNYMGGHAPRYANILKGCTVKISGADIIVEGNDIESCGQTAANIEKSTSRLGFDRRTFQDGIYIVQKSHKVKE